MKEACFVLLILVLTSMIISAQTPTSYITIIAGFKLTEQSFKELKDEDIPEDILKALKPLENLDFYDEERFLEAIKKHIGEEQIVRYKTLILKHAIRKEKNLCLQVNDDLIFGDGADIVLGTCLHDSAIPSGMLFEKLDTRSGNFFLRSQISQKCIQASQIANDNVVIIQTTCQNLPEFQWKTKPGTKGDYIINQRYQQCLHTVDDKKLSLKNCEDTSTQWNIVPY